MVHRPIFFSCGVLRSWNGPLGAPCSLSRVDASTGTSSLSYSTSAMPLDFLDHTSSMRGSFENCPALLAPRGRSLLCRIGVHRTIRPLLWHFWRPGHRRHSVACRPCRQLGVPWPPCWTSAFVYWVWSPVATFPLGVAVGLHILLFAHCSATDEDIPIVCLGRLAFLASASDVSWGMATPSPLQSSESSSGLGASSPRHRHRLAWLLHMTSRGD